MAEDTIFAVATGGAPAGIAVIRLSGPDAPAALERLSGRDVPPPRRAVRVRLRDAAGAGLDDGLALFFPAPASFTGEDVVELHLHGGRATLAAVGDALAGLPGLRPAEPGEFTRRAFLNGKMDLTRAEALADLVAAETEAQRVQALRQLGGGLAARYEDWRTRLIGILAHVEAAVDFADEEVPADLLEGVQPKIWGLIEEVTQHLDDRHRGERLRSGVVIAILGAPNVGKSSLLNQLARREAAIVSETAGTTRDVIEVHLDLGGLPVTVADTAGLRAAAGAVEAEGVRRARARAREADLRLAVFDATRWPELDPATRALCDADTVAVLNKSDLGGPGDSAPEIATADGPRPLLRVSARTGAGLGALLAVLEDAVRKRLETGGPPPLTRARHRAALEDAAAALARIAPGQPVELMAEELRLAARAIGRITGRVDVEDVLDQVFAEFCIGK